MNYLTINTPIDNTTLQESRFNITLLKGEEGLCQDFEYEVDLTTSKRLSDAEIEKLVGERVTININYLDSNQTPDTRFINGLVYQLTEIGVSRTVLSNDIWRYHLQLGSFLTQLRRVRDCRVFQNTNNTALSIVKDILRENGLYDIREEQCKGVLKRSYVVMYNESLYNFVVRLLHEDGVLWRFEHEKDKHYLVFSLDSTRLPSLKNNSTTQTDSVYSFCRQGNFIPVRTVETVCYNWQQPPIQTAGKGVSNATQGLRDFEYPGRFSSRKMGEMKVARQASALNSQMIRYQGASTTRAFEAGKRFTLRSPRVLPEKNDTPFVLLSLRISATENKYQNEFTAIEAKVPYLPLAEDGISKPRIYGSQTAIVAGASETNVQTDEWGQVVVRFHWDHLTASNSSYPSASIRVAGPAAGDRRGFIFIPKIGEEVVVVFEDGDPDKPLIIGSVYSVESNPPFSPAAHPYKSVIKTSDDANSNQIVFEDKPGSEVLEMKAKKDMNIEVGGNLDINVKNHISIKARSIDIKVAKDAKITAGGSILNMAVATINNVAGGAISNMAVGGVLNLAGGITLQAAGGMMTNTAILSVANTSAFGIKQESKGVIANTAVGAVLNTGSQVVNAADAAVLNTSGGAIINTASKDLNNEALLLKNKSLLSNTESDSYSIKGITKINS